MGESWPGCCFDLREQPELLDVIVLWLHAEWLKQRKDFSQNPAEAYASRRMQLQAHLGFQLIPITLVAKESKERSKPVLGCVSLTQLTPPSASLLSGAVKYAEFKNALWLSNLFVTPTARGRAIAQSLLNAAQAKALDLGWREIYLYTHSSKAYYLAKGWREVKMAAKQTAMPALAKVCVLKKQLGAYGA